MNSIMGKVIFLSCLLMGGSVFGMNLPNGQQRGESVPGASTRPYHWYDPLNLCVNKQLFCAVLDDDVREVLRLLNVGANVRVADYGTTPLQIAIDRCGSCDYAGPGYRSLYLLGKCSSENPCVQILKMLRRADAQQREAQLQEQLRKDVIVKAL